MEVLTAVDREQIEAPCVRDEFFWLRLTAPPVTDLETAGELRERARDGLGIDALVTAMTTKANRLDALHFWRRAWL